MTKKQKSGSLKIKLDVGCGPHKRRGFVGVDRKKLPGVDVVINLDEENLPYEDSSVDEIYCSHFLEHVLDPCKTLEEFNRVLKNNGLLTITVPHYSNPYSYHFTHKTYWSSFSLNQEYIDYYINTNLVLISKKIRVVLFGKLDTIINIIVNINSGVYERIFSGFIKAWEVTFILKKDRERSGKISI